MPGAATPFERIAMKLGRWISAIGRGLWRQACRACIERCALIAGTALGGELLDETYFYEKKIS
jgi:hypothetical protein